MFLWSRVAGTSSGSLLQVFDADMGGGNHGLGYVQDDLHGRRVGCSVEGGNPVFKG